MPHEPSWREYCMIFKIFFFFFLRYLISLTNDKILIFNIIQTTVCILKWKFKQVWVSLETIGACCDLLRTMLIVALFNMDLITLFDSREEFK